LSKAAKVDDKKAETNIFGCKKSSKSCGRVFQRLVFEDFFDLQKTFSNQILLYIFVLETLLFRTKKRSSRYDIPSQNYIKNKINAKLLPHPLFHDKIHSLVKSA
jgi:hypothetical protein